VCRARRHAVRTAAPFASSMRTANAAGHYELDVQGACKVCVCPTDDEVIHMVPHERCATSVDGRRGWRAIYFATVVRERPTPSFAQFAVRRGAPQSLFSWLMRRISVRVSARAPAVLAAATGADARLCRTPCRVHVDRLRVTRSQGRLIHRAQTGINRTQKHRSRR